MTASLRGWSALLVVGLFGQLIIGAILRHTGWGLVWHIAGSLIVGGCLMLVARQVLTLGIGEEVLRGPVMGLFALFGAQLALGFSSLLAVYAVDTPVPQTRTQAYLPTIHVAIGAVLTGLSFYVALRAHALRAPDAQAALSGGSST